MSSQVEWRPALRPDLVRLPPDPERGEGEALFDPVLNRRVNLGARSRAMAPLLDGTHPLGEVLAAGAAASGDACGEPGAASGDAMAAAVAAEAAFRSLLCMGLIDGSGAEIVARARAVQARELPLEPVLLPGTRFGCQGSGDCCKSYVFGPLTDEDVARLQALPIEEKYPYLGPGPYVDVRPLRDGTERPFLRTFGQQCIFQLPDERCGLHAAFGEDAKPGLCRLYPYQHVPTIFGRKIYDRSECATFAVSARCGTELADELPRVLSLLPAEFDIYHPLVLLAEEAPCDYGHFYRLQEAMCAAMGEDDRRGPGARLAACAAWLRRFIDEVRRCPLSPGEPDRTVDGVVSQAPAPAPLSEAERAAGLRALAALCADLRAELVPHRMVIERARSQRRAHAQLLELDQALGALQAVAAHGAGDLAELPEPLRPLADLAPDPLASETADAALRLSLRAQLFSDRALVEGRPAAGLLRAALIQLVTLVRARLAARGRRPGVAEISAGHALAIRVLSQEIVNRVFVQHDGAALLCAEAAATLLPAGRRPG